MILQWASKQTSVFPQSRMDGDGAFRPTGKVGFYTECLSSFLPEQDFSFHLKTPWAFVASGIILSATLLGICYAKGEPPHWRWGAK
jgi:hypothetical protein